MYRYNERTLKVRRIHRRINFNKEKNNPHTSEYSGHGTGTRFRSYDNEYIRKHNEFASLCVKEGFDKRDLWETPLPKPLYESAVHDRTRWQSSVAKTRGRTEDRALKAREQVAFS